MELFFLVLCFVLFLPIIIIFTSEFYLVYGLRIIISVFSLLMIHAFSALLVCVSRLRSRLVSGRIFVSSFRFHCYLVVHTAFSCDGVVPQLLVIKYPVFFLLFSLFCLRLGTLKVVNIMSTYEYVRVYFKSFKNSFHSHS